MAKKKTKTEDEPKFVIKKRVPKEKPDFFQNIPDIKSQLHHPHPLAEVFEFPQPQPPATDLDYQNDEVRLPLDNHYGTADKTDKAIIGYPKMNDLDSQIKSPLHPINPNLDSQISGTGYPNLASLDSNIAQSDSWIAKEEGILDSNIAGQANLEIQKNLGRGKWKKYDKKRSTASVFIRADEELINEIKHFNIERKLDMREFFELSARSFIDNTKNPKAEDLDSNIAFNKEQVMILWRTKPDIINLYLKYNPKKKWKIHDDRAASKFNDIDLRIVELGILQTLGNASFKARVNSFAYFAPEIETWIGNPIPEESLETIVSIYRLKWKTQNT